MERSPILYLVGLCCMLIQAATNTNATFDGERCGQNWFYDSIGQACYRIYNDYYNDRVSWSAAQERCEEEDANLPSILSADEQTTLMNVLQTQYVEYTWIGANSLEEDGVWQWSDGSEFSYTTWYYGEPTQYGDENCAGAIRWNSFMWNDDDCDMQKNFVCKKPASGPSVEPTIPATREPCTETGITELVCGFESVPGYALYGHNDKVIRYSTAANCKKACLNETEFECLSFDFTLRSKSCYLSANNRETANDDDFSTHGGSVYYEKSCAEVDTCYLEPVSCTVNLQSWGVKDANSQKTSFIQVNDETVFETSWSENNTDMVLPGIYVAILDLNTCSTSNLRNFGNHYTQMYELGNYMRSTVPDDGFVLWISAGQLNYDLKYYLSDYGLQVTDLQPNGKFAAVTQKGYPEKTQPVVGSDCIKGNNVQATIEIEGSIIVPEDSTITIISESGNILNIE